MLEILELGLSCVVLDLFLGLELSDLFLAFIELFLTHADAFAAIERLGVWVKNFATKSNPS